MDRCKKEEPQVINSAMLVKCIDEQAPPGEAGRLQREEGTPFDEVEKLRLEFQRILRIDHVWMLTALTKLSLSNNLIEKIDNLEALVNLKDLDLSFNKITKIENLDTLVNIEILSFFENRICVIENLEHMKKLLIFSIGQNQIEDRNNVIYLRQFPFLQSVNMERNPCADADDFVQFVVTMLPKITYYQYKLVEASNREYGQEKYEQLLMYVYAEEKKRKIVEDKILAEINEAELHVGSFVEFLGTDHLFNQMFENDKDGKALLNLSKDCQERYENYKEQFCKYTLEIFDMGQVQYRIRKKEVDQFFECINNAKQKSQQESIDKMEGFLLKKTDMFAKVKQLEDSYNNNMITDEECFEMIQVVSDEYNDLLHNIWKDLMKLELTLYEQMEEVISVFEQTVTEMINNFIENSQSYFTEMRASEAIYHEILHNEANEFLTQCALKEGTPIPEELVEMMSDRDNLINSLGATHEMHNTIIDNREDTLVSKARNWLNALVTSLTKNEIVRNRSKVLEINHFLDIQREEFEDLQSFAMGPLLDDEVNAVIQ
ncbi:hypothetical protein FQA39_LY01883 [Lamprigera yunnana]|nr:hypothetical protein FQA39_LY01883 [Lamprigera yunnana]